MGYGMFPSANMMPQQYGMMPQGMYSYGAQQSPQFGGQSGQTLNRVTGYEGAKAFQILPNSTAALFDDTRDVFYIKSTDSGGFPTIRAFAFTPLDVAENPQAGTALSREEIQGMIAQEVQKYAEQFIREHTAPAEAHEQNGAGSTT